MKTSTALYGLGSLLLLPLIQSCAQKPEKSEIMENRAFIGTYTQPQEEGQSKGIYSIYQNPETGALEMGHHLAALENPSFVKTSLDGKNLYAVSELNNTSGFIHSYSINQDGTLTEIGKVGTEGTAPCHIAVDATDKYVFVSNYVGGVVMMYERTSDGNLQTKQVIELEQPQVSHAHSLTLSPDNKQAYVADLGNDRIWIFEFDDTEGILKPHEQPFVTLREGAGPRHFTMNEEGEMAYSINELNSSLSVFKVKKDGGLKLVQNISTLPDDFSGESFCADIHMHPSGRFLYGSNRGHNSIAIFQIGQNGQLRRIGHQSTQGEWPRNFAIDPDGNYLYVANQHSNTITSFEIDKETGDLDPHQEPIEVMSPVCIEFEIKSNAETRRR